ncbi:MAG: hypothetical protein JJ899_08645 [Alphaproteobacteria bacterium]|nr:hypothetical protein [Alphaproteobacteria bacterium]
MVEIQDLTISDANVAVDISQDGTLNWQSGMFDGVENLAARANFPMHVQMLTIRNTNVVWRDARNGKSGRSTIEQLSLQTQSTDTPTQIAGAARFERATLPATSAPDATYEQIAEVAQMPDTFELQVSGTDEMNIEIIGQTPNVSEEQAALQTPAADNRV